MGAEATATTVPVTDKSTHHPQQRGALDRELFCPRLQRLLLGAASELGQRGNLAQVVASIERGGVSGGGEDPNYAALRRIGWRDDVDKNGRYIPPTDIMGPLKELAQRWRGLDKKRQATALALYLGTARCHPTLREHFGEGQGGLAGVVLYRWQLKQVKGRARDASGAGAKVVAELAAIWGELGPLEREQAELRELLAQPAAQPTLDPRPLPPEIELVLSRKLVAAAQKAHRAAVGEWRAKVRLAYAEVAGERDRAIDRLAALEDLVAPLRARQALLCAQQAELAAGPPPPVAQGKETVSADPDEHALVLLCRGGLDKQARAEMLAAAEADVRTLHRAWYATALKAAKAWLEDAEPAA